VIRSGGRINSTAPPNPVLCTIWVVSLLAHGLSTGTCESGTSRPQGYSMRSSFSKSVCNPHSEMGDRRTRNERTFWLQFLPFLLPMTSRQCDSERRALWREAFDEQRAPFNGSHRHAAIVHTRRRNWRNERVVLAGSPRDRLIPLMLATLFLPQSPANQNSPSPPAAYPIGQGVTPPILLHETKPNYTAAAMRARIQGVVASSVLSCRTERLELCG
jgi:hypothetical protein